MHYFVCLRLGVGDVPALKEEWSWNLSLTYFILCSKALFHTCWLAESMNVYTGHEAHDRTQFRLNTPTWSNDSFFQDVKVLINIAKHSTFKTLTWTKSRRAQSRSVRQEIMICHREPWKKITHACAALFKSFILIHVLEQYFKSMNLTTDELHFLTEACKTQCK